MWNKCGAADAKTLEDSYQARVPGQTVILTLARRRYTIDFDQMNQISIQTGMKRDISRGDDPSLMAPKLVRTKSLEERERSQIEQEEVLAQLYLGCCHFESTSSQPKETKQETDPIGNRTELFEALFEYAYQHGTRRTCLSLCRGKINS